ncbi:MAG TPA: LON peptidase substrate-binding domain-containing protein [Acidimicrobiales bacterium]|nr:LON peptidase substrate-binding domain-containing protein [Acidimicrobiales bacterium]
MTEIRMFPLGSVLFPHMPLPLHVFEPRYRALVHDCLAGDRTFGVVLIERGHEVGGGDVRFGTGCTARIAEAEETPDGRWGLIATGVTRFRVDSWLPDDPYPRAEVTMLDDGGWTTDASIAMDHATAVFARVLDLAVRLGSTVDSSVLERSGDPVLDHWTLVSRAPVGALDQLSLLAAETPERRLDLLTNQLAEVETVLASRLGGG